MRVGIDMDGMTIKFGLVDDKNMIVAKSSIPTEHRIHWTDLVVQMSDAVKKLLVDSEIEMTDCEGIGIACPGTIDNKKGIILYSNNLNWENIPIVEELKKHLNLPIRIANDADAAALAEVKAGVAVGRKNVVLLTLGTSVGSGVIVDGKIFYGPFAGGCELGHMVIKAGGVPCTCGRCGCLESYASATALVRIAKEKMEVHKDSSMRMLAAGDISKIDGKLVFAAQNMRDAAAVEAVAEYDDYLSIGITNIINIFRPEMVILGGGISGQKQSLTNVLDYLIRDKCLDEAHGQIAEIATSSLGADAGMIGAANLSA